MHDVLPGESNVVITLTEGEKERQPICLFWLSDTASGLADVSRPSPRLAGAYASYLEAVTVGLPLQGNDFVLAILEPLMTAVSNRRRLYGVSARVLGGHARAGGYFLAYATREKQPRRTPGSKKHQTTHRQSPYARARATADLMGGSSDGYRPWSWFWATVINCNSRRASMQPAPVRLAMAWSRWVMARWLSPSLVARSLM